MMLLSIAVLWERLRDNCLFLACWEKFSRQHLEVFFLFFPGNRFWHFMQRQFAQISRPIFMKKKKITKISSVLLSVKFAQTVLKVLKKTTLITLNIEINRSEQTV